MPLTTGARRAAALVAAALAAPLVAHAQAPRPAADTSAHPEHHAASAPRIVWSLGAHGVGLVTRADPAFDGRAYTEGYLTQPMVTGRLALPRAGVSAAIALNFEGLTLERGELNAGVYGEGYVDRRHPHTLLHEAMVSVGGRLGRSDDAAADVRWSASVGKGFVPFGTDDPMSRPFVKFPVNHHLSQLLERLVAQGGVRTRWAMVEGALFNGDEPTGPYAWPAAARFGDSWAARLTAFPAAGVELSASVAEVRSPELRAGGGLDQRKLNAAARLAWGESAPGGHDDHAAAPRLYLLLEASRTDDLSRGRHAFRYESVLGEGALRTGAWTTALRLEQTVRPEEERLLDPFRSPRPHAEASIIGLTRWRVASVGVTRALDVGYGIRVHPLVEASWAHAAEQVRPAAFEPARFYGAASQWSLSVGVRIGAGGGHGRMGRYGVAADSHGTPPAS